MGNAQHIATSQVVVTMTMFVIDVDKTEVMMLTLVTGESKVEATTPTFVTDASVTHLAIVVTIAAVTATGGQAAVPGLEAPNDKTMALGPEAPNG